MSNGATISDERLILILDKIVERRGVSNLSELLIHPITKHINELLKNTVRHGDRVYMKDAELDVRSRLEDIKKDCVLKAIEKQGIDVRQIITDYLAKRKLTQNLLQRQTREHFARTLEKAEDEFFTKLADQEFDTYKSENVWLIKDKITDGKVSIPEGDINVPDVGQAIADENLFDLIGTNHDEVKETMDEVVAQKSTNITYEQLVIDLTNILLFGTVTVDPSDENGDESLQRSTDPDAEMVMLTTTPSSQLARQQQPPQPTPDYLARYSKELVINNIRGGFISDRDMRTWQGRMSVHVNMKQRTFNVISAATNLDSLQVGLEPVLQKQGRAAVGGRIEKARIEFSFVVEGNRVRVYATNKTEDCFCSLLPNCYNVKKASDYWISSASTAKEKTYLFIANKNDETSFFYNFEEGVEEIDLDIFMTIDCAPNLPFIKNLPRPITDNNIMVALS